MSLRDVNNSLRVSQTESSQEVSKSETNTSIRSRNDKGRNLTESSSVSDSSDGEMSIRQTRLDHQRLETRQVNTQNIETVNNLLEENGIPDGDFTSMTRQVDKLSSKKRLGALDNLMSNQNLSEGQKGLLENKKENLITSKLEKDGAKINGSPDEVKQYVKNFIKITSASLGRETTITPLHDELKAFARAQGPDEKIDSILRLNTLIDGYKTNRGNDSSKLGWVNELQGKLKEELSTLAMVKRDMMVQEVTDKGNSVTELPENATIGDMGKKGREIKSLLNEIKGLEVRGLGTQQLKQLETTLESKKETLLESLTQKKLEYENLNKNTFGIESNISDLNKPLNLDGMMKVNQLSGDILSNINFDQHNIDHAQVTDSVKNFIGSDNNVNFWDNAFIGTKENIFSNLKSDLKIALPLLNNNQLEDMANSIYTGYTQGINAKLSHDVKPVGGYYGNVPPLDGVTVGNTAYTEGTLLFNGGGGELYTYKNTDSDDKVVLKKFKDPVTARNDVENYIKILQDNNSENIPSLKGIFVDEASGETFAVMQFIDGGDIKGWGNTINQKPDLEKLEIMQKVSGDILKGLESVEGSGFMHRDIKPENFLYDKQTGNLLLGDFGESCPNIKGQNGLSGTPHYRSPEMINGQPYDNKADVWALGLSLVQLYTGDLPFGLSLDDQSFDVGPKITNIPPGTLAFPNPQNDFEEMVNKMLNTDPDQRPTFTQLKNEPFFSQVFAGGTKALLDPLG